MHKKIGAIVLVLSFMAAMVGCDAGVIMGSKAVGVRSGEFVYSAGYVVSTYTQPLERVWQAAEAVMKDMKATGVTTEKKIALSVISGLIMEEKGHD